MSLRRGQRFQLGAQKFRVAYVNESRAHCVGVVKQSVTVNDRKSGSARTFEAERKVTIDISPESAVDLLGKERSQQRGARSLLRQRVVLTRQGPTCYCKCHIARKCGELLMPSLPRRTCSVCGMSVPVRVNGAAREHNYQGGPAIGKCAGSGKPTKPTFDEALANHLLPNGMGARK